MLIVLICETDLSSDIATNQILELGVDLLISWIYKQAITWLNIGTRSTVGNGNTTVLHNMHVLRMEVGPLRLSGRITKRF